MMRKNITFINMNPPYELKASTLILSCPDMTESIQQVLVYDDELRIRDLSKGDDEKNEKNLELCEESFKKIYENSHTVILPDAMFSDQSKIFKTKAFTKHGLNALEPFYKSGGRVIVTCLEGVFNVTQKINKLFGTNWKTRFFENSIVEPTFHGKRLFGQFVQDQYLMKENPYFIDCPLGEGLFQVKMDDKESFIENFHAEDATFEKLGIEKDETMDCFNEEKSWNNYLKKYTDRYCIALHEGKGAEGEVIWFGDRGSSEGIVFIFCKLFNLNRRATSTVPMKFNYVDERSSGDVLPARQGPSMSLLFSAVVVLFAIVAKYIGSQ